MVEIRQPSEPRPASTEESLNVALVGDMSTGKSCLAMRFVRGDETGLKTLRDMVGTIGMGALFKNVRINGKKVQVIIWDTAGQEKFRSLTRSYYRQANAVMLVYDVTKRESFDNLPYWYRELRSNGNDTAVLAVVGTKIDKKGRRQVSYEEAHRFAQQHDCLFFETSAFTGQGVQEPFFELIRKAVDTKNLKYPPRSRASDIRVTDVPNNAKADPGCAC